MVSNRLDIIGMDIDTIITFPPISTLLAIADSPESLQMLTANSVKKAIPVIFINRVKNALFIAVLFDKEVNRLIIPPILSIMNNKINGPARRETYKVNSGLYCLTIIMIIKEIKPTPIILITSIIIFIPSLQSKHCSD